ncbi:MAG: hypothetical protein ACKO50_12065 [Cyanobium sp.]
MARKQDRFAQKAAQQIQAGGRTVRLRRSAMKQGVDGSYLRESIQAWVSDWAVETDGRTRLSQYAALRQKGIADLRFR